jgi:hypothetical protein
MKSSLAPVRPPVRQQPAEIRVLFEIETPCPKPALHRVVLREDGKFYMEKKSRKDPEFKCYAFTSSEESVLRWFDILRHGFYRYDGPDPDWVVAKRKRGGLH